jgi:hypothetical protein
MPNNVEYLQEHCPEALRAFEDLTRASLRLKYHLLTIAKPEDHATVDEAVRWHVNETITKSYEDGILAMKMAGEL